MVFVCGRCLGSMKDDDPVEKSVNIGEGVELEKVREFCCFVDMLDADGGVDSAVTTRVKFAWNKFKELRPFLTTEGVSLQVKGKVYESCVGSCMTYGRETWPLKVEHESRLETTYIRMIRWMCGVSLRDRVPSKELGAWVGVEAISDVCMINRLRWFRHVERKGDDDWVKRCTRMEVEGNRPRGRPKKTWMKTLEDNISRCALSPDDAMDRL
jgi:hypothetical protein